MNKISLIVPCYNEETNIKPFYNEILKLFNDSDKNKLYDAYSEDTYNNAERIVVPNENAAKELQELARYTGYCCYEDITECGEWHFDYKKDTFVKG